MNRNQNYLRQSLRLGLIGGGVALALSAIGMVALFAGRRLIGDVLTLGHLMLFMAPAAAGYLAAERAGKDRQLPSLVSGLIAGLSSSGPLLILIAITQVVDLRQFLVNVSPALIELLTFGQPDPTAGGLLLLLAMGVTGLAAAIVRELPDRARKPLLSALVWTLGIGMLSEILAGRFRGWFGSPVSRLVFERASLRLFPAVVIFLAAFAVSIYRERGREEREGRAAPAETVTDRGINWRGMAILTIILLILPLVLGTYLSEVVDNIGIFVLMGLGLNIVVGFAGLLDLGYVAFFAIGAYTMAILTSQGSLGTAGLSFWAALPIAVLAAVIAGILLGIPVLRMRGDYLAIVTLGFGEIIRILALSDLLKPYIGGAQGVLQIPKPSLFGFRLIQPEYLYYIILAGSALAWFVSWRLSEARLGRQWKAMREDEDVAEAMGIRLVTTKLLAFGIGAAFSGLAGAIFAPKLTSIFPHSFSLLISINVLSLIIVGGIGSLPGVVVGALVLVGLPELLREFDEYRLLMYGALLIVMMLAKPEGFWPSQIRRRELHAHEEHFPAIEDDKLGEGVRAR